MRTKKSIPEIGSRDKMVALYILERYYKMLDIPTPSQIAAMFGFTRQAGGYYLDRMIQFKLLTKGKRVGAYRIAKKKPSELSLSLLLKEVPDKWKNRIKKSA